MSLRHLTCAALTLAIAAGAADAQETSTTPGFYNRADDGAVGNDGTGASRFLVSLTAADKMATGTIELFGWQPRSRLHPPAHGLHESERFSLWLRASGPLDESDSKAPVVLADLNGQRQATTVALGLGLRQWPWRSNRPAREALCREVFSDTTLGYPDALKEPIRKAVAAVPPSNDQTALAAARRAALERVADSLSLKRCASENLPLEQRRALGRLVDYGRIWQAFGSIEYGRQGFKFADTTAATYTKAVHYPFAATLGTGWYFPRDRVRLSATVRYERSFQGGSARQYCVPVAGGPALQCRSLPLGPPDTSSAVMLGAEVRWFTNDRFGLSPRFTTDVSADRGWGVELPILLHGSEPGFTSALTLGYRSKPSSPDVDDRAYVAVTIGVTFGIKLEQ